MQQRMGQHLGGIAHRGVYQRRGTDRHHGLGHQRQVVDARPVLVSEVDRCVKGAVLDRERLQPGGQVHRDLRVAAGKVAQPGRQPVHPESGQDRQVQGTAARVGPGRDAGLRQAVQNVADMTDIGPARLCQDQLTALACQKLHAKLILQRLELPADRRLGQRQLFGGAGGGAKPCHRFEGEQGGDRGQETSGRDHL